MNPMLLDYLACPRCHAALRYERSAERLVCAAEQVAYPVRDGIADLLPESAVALAPPPAPSVAPAP